MEFFAPSSKATGTPRRQLERKYSFPFDTVPLRMSFSVGKTEVLNIDVLRTLASRNGKRLKRKFKVIDHGEQGYEVFYKEAIADTSATQTATIADDGDIPGRYRG